MGRKPFTCRSKTSWFLHECVLDKQEVAWQWHEFHFAEMFQKKVVDAVFRRMAHLNVVATAFQFFL